MVIFIKSSVKSIAFTISRLGLKIVPFLFKHSLYFTSTKELVKISCHLIISMGKAGKNKRQHSHELNGCTKDRNCLGFLSLCHIYCIDGSGCKIYPRKVSLWCMKYRLLGLKYTSHFRHNLLNRSIFRIISGVLCEGYL